MNVHLSPMYQLVAAHDIITVFCSFLLLLEMPDVSLEDEDVCEDHDSLFLFFERELVSISHYTHKIVNQPTIRTIDDLNFVCFSVAQINRDSNLNLYPHLCKENLHVKVQHK
jgi:hypothetical protein